MSPLPGVKKDANGLPILVGVGERISTQQQQDYTDTTKGLSLITGPQGYEARKMFQENPEASAGMITSLARSGAIAGNPLITTLAQIDKQTQDKRKTDAIIASNKVSTEKFNNTLPGQLWTGLKGLSRNVGLGFDAIIQTINAPFRVLVDDFQKVKEEGGLFERTETTTFDRVAEAIKKTPGQVTLFQAIKQQVQEGKIDLGAGFLVSEEIGAGFAARKEQLKYNKQSFKQNGVTYYRPYSIFDPAAYVISAGHPESGIARVVVALGEIGASVKLDPFLAYSKLAKATADAKKISEATTGVGAARAAKKASILESQLKLIEKRTSDALIAMGGATTEKSKAIKLETYLKNFRAYAKLEDEFNNLKIDYKAISTFISGERGAHIVDAIANEDNWLAIQKLSKGNLTADQAIALAGAKNREEVLRVLATYIANGDIIQRSLESGTKTGRALKGVVESAGKSAAGRAISDSFETVLPTADRIRAGAFLRGAAARGVQRLPLHNTILKVSDELHMFGRKYGALLPQSGGTLIHLSNKDALLAAVNNVGRFMKLDKATLDNLLTEVATASNVSASGTAATSKLFNAIFDKYKGQFTGEQLVAWKEATRVFETERLNMSKYWAQQHATGADLTFSVIGGEKINLHSAHLDSELLNSFVFIPDPKAMQDFIKTSQKWAGLSVGKNAVAIADFTSDLNSLWKKSVLVRPAYIVRNIIEEQIRVFGTGHSSFLNHPLAAMAMWLGRPEGKTWRKVLNQFDAVKNDVYGNTFKMASSKEEFASAEIAGDLSNDYVAFMSDTISGMGGDGEMSKVLQTIGYSAEVFGHPNWWSGFANQVRILHNSEFVRAVIRTKPGNELATVKYFLTGKGAPTLERFLVNKAEETKKFLNTEEGLLQFLFKGKNDKGDEVSVLARIEELAGRGVGAPLLKELLLKGTVVVGKTTVIIPTGKTIAARTLEIDKKTKILNKKITKRVNARADLHKEFSKTLQSTFSDTGNWDGIYMTVPKPVIGRTGIGKGGYIDEKVAAFFDIAVRFEKTSTMGPEWRQSYWDAIQTMSSSLDKKAINELLAAAPKSLGPLRNPVTGRAIGKEHKAWESLRYASGDGVLNLDEVHEYAVKYANKSVTDLFYNASKRNLLWHQLRLIAPFGQAWEDTAKAWGRIALNNPSELYKVGKVGDWLSGPDSSALYELTDARDYYDPNQGFFFADPQSGERQFFVPFASTTLNVLQTIIPGSSPSRTSGPFAFTAKPQSFNFALGAGTFLPGFGMGVLWSVAALDAINKNPLKILPAEWEEQVFKVAFPYGIPDVRNAGLLDVPVLSSSWVRTISAVFGVESSFAAAFAPVMGYLASSGDYNLLDPDDQSRLTKDSHNLAQYFVMWRGLFGALTPIPFAMSPKALAKNENSDTVLATTLWTNFKNIEAAAGGDKAKAYADFLDTYGPEQVFALIKSTTGYEPTNLPTYNMIKEDPSVIDKYPDVYGYFYPNGELSAVLYRYQKERGAVGNRQTAREVLDKAVNILYTASKDRLMTRSIGEGWSASEYSDALSSLTDSYTKYGRKAPEYDTAWKERAIAQIELAADDTNLADSGALIAAKAYILMRQDAITASGMKTLDNKASAPQRAWLAQEALRLLNKYPDFQKIFYGVFKKELED